MDRRRGFTLIEMMIVVSIIAIIAAIAIPNLLRTRLQANEAATIEDLRGIHEAQVAFNTVHERFGDFDELTLTTDGPPYLDSTWTEGRTKSGYQYTMPVAAEGAFVCFASPESAGVSGVRYFRIDQSGIVRYSVDGEPAADATAVGTPGG